MPRRAKGARLYLRAERKNERTGKITEAAVWTIRDGSKWQSTGCSAADIGGAEQALSEYIIGKHEVDRTPERSADQILVADVISIYAEDVAPRHSRPTETAARLENLLDFWKHDTLSAITGKSCRAYVKARLEAQNKAEDQRVKKRGCERRPATPAAARRELEELRAAINYHRKEGFCTEVVSVVLPDKNPSRDRFLTRLEVAKMLWKAWRFREMQKGKTTDRFSRRHIARFILVGIYTGTRAGAICGAAFKAGPGQGYLDLDRGVFYRKFQGAAVTKKRQPPVRLPDRLLAHIRRWKEKGSSKNFAVEFGGERIGRLNKAFRNVAEDAGLGPDVTPHVLRHTAATWMMMNGVDMNMAAGFLGMTVETLERIYGHHHPDFQKDAAAGVSKHPGKR